MGGRHGKRCADSDGSIRDQDVVQRYTDIISIIADVDVEVVDEHLVRIAGTGLFADVVNKDMSGEGYVYRKVLATGERSVIYQPGEEIICRDCLIL